jgi:hypothetical protein
MHSKYLQCDGCETAIDKRPPDDHGGRYAGSVSRGAFAPYEDGELITYALSLGWKVFKGDEHYRSVHYCPVCAKDH